MKYQLCSASEFLLDLYIGISRPLNVVIAMDGSQNVNAETFNKIKKFAVGTLDGYDISRNKTLVSVVTFGNTSSVNLDLASSFSKSIVQYAISTAKRVGGRRSIARLAEFIQKGILSRKKRIGAGDVLVLVVAGSNQQESDSGKLKSSLEELERRNIKLVVVAVGEVAKSGELAKSVKDDSLVMIPSVSRIKEALTPIVDASGKAAGIGLCSYPFKYLLYLHRNLQSLPKVLGNLQYFLDCLIPLSPSKQCWFMEDIHAAHMSIYLHLTLMDAPVYLNIVLRGERVVILHCRPETYNYHVKHFIE